MGTKQIVKAFAVTMAAGSLLTGTVFANETSESASTTTASKKSTKDTSRRICRNLTLSGTRLTTRFCRTEAEWDAEAEKAFKRAVQQKGNAAGDLTPVNAAFGR